MVDETEAVKETVTEKKDPNTIDVVTSIGTWTIVKPKAGVRNRALAKAETESGGFKKTTMFMELLPKCVRKRPEDIDQTVPIEHILDDLSIEDYDTLFEGLYGLINPELAKEDEDQKKT